MGMVLAPKARCEVLAEVLSRFSLRDLFILAGEMPPTLQNFGPYIQALVQWSFCGAGTLGSGCPSCFGPPVSELLGGHRLLKDLLADCSHSWFPEWLQISSSVTGGRRLLDGDTREVSHRPHLRSPFQALPLPCGSYQNSRNCSSVSWESQGSERGLRSLINFSLLSVFPSLVISLLLH